MSRVYAAATVVFLTVLREWKATAALLIALYVAVALVAFLDRSLVWQCIGTPRCR